jgi:DNA-binding response OmpR family regulator
MTRLLVMSADRETRAAFLQHFMQNGTVVSTAAHASTAQTLMSHSEGYHLVVLDMAGRSNGLHVLQHVQAHAGAARILAIVDRDSPEMGLHYVQAGADDFVTKPFIIHELDVRMKALLQRGLSSGPTPHHEYTIRGLTFDFETRTCHREGQCINLTAKEFDLLDHLFKHRGRTVSREDLVEGVWGGAHVVSTRTVDRHITSIRRKIEADPSSPVYLQTIYGEGYRFMPMT